jgi:hypothetical protein
MSYQYGSILYPTARQAARAAVSDFLYAGGWNSAEQVASMDAADVMEELEGLINRGEWSMPLDMENNEIADMVREIIAEARAKTREE